MSTNTPMKQKPQTYLTMALDSPLLRPDNRTGKYLSFGLAIAVHVLLAMLLFYGVRWQTKMPDVVEVELFSAPPAEAPSPAPPRTLPEPVAEPAPPAAKAPPPPEPVKQPAKPDIAIKEKVKEPPKPAPKPEPKPEVKPEPAPEAPPAPPRKTPFFEQLKKEAEQLLQRKKTDAMAENLAKESSARAAAARNKAMADYLSRIRSKVRGNIVLPPDIQGNPEAVFEVTQLPSGEIVTARLRHSSGNPALDAAIERAILKSNPLPKPEKNELFSRTLELSYRPLDE
jgi:colicin import membrane protein